MRTKTPWLNLTPLLPPHGPQANPELTAIWAVGQHIWQRDFPGIYTAIAAQQWSESILPVMEALRGKNKKNTWASTRRGASQIYWRNFNTTPDVAVSSDAKINKQTLNSHSGGVNEMKPVIWLHKGFSWIYVLPHGRSMWQLCNRLRIEFLDVYSVIKTTTWFGNSCRMVQPSDINTGLILIYLIFKIHFYVPSIHFNSGFQEKMMFVFRFE